MNRLGKILSGAMLGVTLITPASFAFERHEIAAAQRCLESLGFSPGPIDGVIGPQSDRAAYRYQESRFGPHWTTVPEKTRKIWFAAECDEIELKTVKAHSY